MKNRKINKKNRRFDLLSWKFRYCSLAFKTNFPRPINKEAKVPKIPIIITSIPITYTLIYLKKLGQVGHFLINLSGSINSSVIYNTPFTGAGFCQSVFSSPSTDWSAFGQALFQKAHFKGGLFGKEGRTQRISPTKQTQGEMRK